MPCNIPQPALLLEVSQDKLAHLESSADCVVVVVQHKMYVNVIPEQACILSAFCN